MATSAADVVSEAHRLFTFIRTPAGEPYALPLADAALYRARPLDALAGDLARAFFVSGDIPGPQIMTAAMSVLSAQSATAEVLSVHLRMAHLAGTSYLDLGTSTGEYVEITATGWTVRRDRPPVVFARTPALGALPVPVRDRAVSRATLAGLLAVSTEDPRFRLMYGWLVAQMLPDVARPFLYLYGSQGSGKTTRGLLLANVLETLDELGGVLKRTERENNPVAKSNYLLTSDNMTKVNEDVSNWLCSLVTGLRVEERKLYTNAETVVYSLKRSGIFTGKHLPSGLQEDALERFITVEFQRMPKGSTRSDAALLAELRAARPAILAALLDDMAAVLGLLPSTEDAAAKDYRFIDYGRVHAALDTIDGTHRGGYVDALNDEAEAALSERVHDMPDLRAVLTVVATYGARGWAGTATELHRAIGRLRPDDRGAWWPATAAHLATRLRNQQYALSVVGLSLAFVRRPGSGARYIEASMSEADRVVWLVESATVADLEDLRREQR